MSDTKKTILIVDDSEIDREILKNILLEEFDVIDVSGGSKALELLKADSDTKIDGMLIDIYMPVMDGFSLLSNLLRNGIRNIPIIMISADALKENILKAAKFGVTAFIKKPFDRKIVLGKVGQLFNVKEDDFIHEEEIDTNLTDKSRAEIEQYSQKLKLLYESFLKDNNMDTELFKKVRELMHFMLEQYSLENPEKKLSSELIAIICDAAYLYDIGKMVVSKNEKEVSGLTETANSPFYTHTAAGSALVRLNNSKDVAFFTKICSEICLQHHEKFDGTGFPNALFGTSISIYAQMCSIAIEFAKTLISTGFDAAYEAIEAQKEAFNPDLCYMLKCMRQRLSAFYKS